jgi:hypothetical protein
MWATFTTLPAGKLFSETLKSIRLLVLCTVITAVPRAEISAFVTAGTSFSAESCTVKIVVSLGVLGLLLLPHPATPKIAIVAATSARRFIDVLLMSQ